VCVRSPCWPRSSVPPPAALEEQALSYSCFTTLALLVRRYVAKAFRKICIAPLIYWYLSLFYVIYCYRFALLNLYWILLVFLLP